MYDDNCGFDESGVCSSYHAGHNVHAIQARLLRERPEHWRDAVISSVDGQTATVAYLDDPAIPTLWHHQDFAKLVQPGDPCTLHENLHVLQVGTRVYCVKVFDGAGDAVDAVSDRRPGEVFIADLASGIGHAGQDS
ncbi:hypothetical protein WDJ51_14540 [Rathayibacter sp. YIM 133350]|uniref:hypothetical protein n=1 Tax=Rathayibacter sp. YIM 133350 TaxID=3131992 RepID=UPI00307EA71D